jgi:hypothetical protein
MANQLNLNLAQEWESWKTPEAKDVQPAPKPGEQAPVNENFKLKTDKPTLIVFLRHCGCPCTSCLSDIYIASLNHHLRLLPLKIS